MESPDGTIIYESGVIAEFASTFAPLGQGLPLYPHEDAKKGFTSSMETAKVKLSMVKYNKL